MSQFWTKRKPIEPGWYWMKNDRFAEESVVQVRVFVDQLCVGNWPLSDHALWAGPIQPPKTKKEVIAKQEFADFVESCYKEE